MGFIDFLTLAAYLFFLGLIILTLLFDRRLGVFYFLPSLPLIFLFVEMKEYPLGKDIADIMLVTLMIGWLVQNRELVKTDINRPLFIFILFTFFELLKGSLFLGTGINLSDIRVEEWKNYMIMPLLFFIVVNNIKTLKECKKLIFFLSIVYLVIGTQFLLTFEDPGKFSWEAKAQYSVFVFFAANHLASFMVQFMAVFLSLYYFLNKNIILRMYFVSLSAIGCLSILFLFSRASYLALAVVTFLLGIIKDRRILVALFCVLLFWNVVLPHSVFQRINMTINAQHSEEGVIAVGRDKMWEHAVHLFKEHPIVGTGYRTFTYTVPQDLKELFSQEIGRPITDTHSLFFNVLAEMGAVGFLLLMYLFFLAARSGWRLFRSTDDGFLKGLGLGFFLCVIAAMITNTFGDRWSNYHVNGYYWIIWALVERGLIITKQEAQVEERGTIYANSRKVAHSV